MTEGGDCRDRGVGAVRRGHRRSAGDGPRARRGDTRLSEDSQEGGEAGKWVLYLSLATPPVHPSLQVSTKTSGEFWNFGYHWYTVGAGQFWLNLCK